MPKPTPAPALAGDGAQAFGAAIGEAFSSLAQLSLPLPALSKLQADYLQQATQIWNDAVERMRPDPKDTQAALPDRRFSASEWAENPARGAHRAGLPAQRPHAAPDGRVGGRRREDAPAHPLRRAAMDRRGEPEQLPRAQPGGAAQGHRDAAARASRRACRTSCRTSSRATSRRPTRRVFEVGRNVATTEGSVVFENELFQLIEYKPLTAAVHQRPMLFVPPCINKYYILDLQPDNSFIRWTVEQGHRTFVMSWRNPDESLADKTWDDYIEHGPIQALRVVQEISGSEKVNTLGFCIGGTILATALAALAARGEHPAASMTLLTTLLDFSETGVLDIFIDEPSVQMREMTIGPQSPTGPHLLKGKELATTFSFLRPNDLVWNYVVGNYLKGETPPPFDLLYWNGDATNLPGPMFCWYLRNTYLENKLKDGVLQVCGQPVNLRDIDVPTYIYGSREDHIVPWTARLRLHAAAVRQEALRAWRVGPHRRRDQPAGQEEAQPLGLCTPCRPARTSGWTRPPSSRAAGGPTGRPGWPSMPASRWPRRARPAAASTSPSSPPLAAT